MCQQVTADILSVTHRVHLYFNGLGSAIQHLQSKKVAQFRLANGLSVNQPGHSTEARKQNSSSQPKNVRCEEISTLNSDQSQD